MAVTSEFSCVAYCANTESSEESTTLSNAWLLSIIAGLGLIALLRSAAQAICLYRHSQFCMIGRRGALIEIWRGWQGRDPARPSITD
jgi:hypothetical protein